MDGKGDGVVLAEDERVIPVEYGCSFPMDKFAHTEESDVGDSLAGGDFWCIAEGDGIGVDRTVNKKGILKDLAAEFEGEGGEVEMVTSCLSVLILTPFLHRVQLRGEGLAGGPTIILRCHSTVASCLELKS